jgi:transposase
MANTETWRRRVAEWRSSGQTAEAFSSGKGYAAGTLFWWSSRLGRASPTVVSDMRGARSGVRLARVVRQATTVSPREAVLSGVSGEVVVELGAMRIIVRNGADAATVGAVLEGARRAARGEGTR